MKTLLIRVTAKDIKEGRKNSWDATKRPFCCFCPVALAIQRLTCQDGWEVASWGNIYRGKSASALPERVRAWIKRFDSGQPVKPISFKIKVP